PHAGGAFPPPALLGERGGRVSQELAAQLQLLVGTDPPRPAGARPRREVAGALALLQVAGDGAGGDRRLGVAAIGGGDDALAQIQAIGVHVALLLCAASYLDNHFATRSRGRPLCRVRPAP